MYSSVPPSMAAPRYRNNSTDIAGVASKRVVRITVKQCMADEERRFSIPEAASINGSFRRCRRLFCLPLCSSSKMPSSSEIFHFSPNFDARVRSTAFLHRQIQTPQMTCFLHCGLVLSLAQSLADLPKVQHRDSPARRYDFQESTRERELMLRVPSLQPRLP